MRKFLLMTIVLAATPALAQQASPEQTAWTSCVDFHVQDSIDQGSQASNETLLAEGFAKCKPEEDKFSATLPAETREADLAKVRASVVSLVNLTHSGSAHDGGY